MLEEHMNRIRSIFLLCGLAIVVCSCSSRSYHEPRILSVQSGDELKTWNSSTLEILDVTNGGIMVRWIGSASEKGTFISAEKESFHIGSSEHLSILSIDPESKTAEIRHSETDRRGLFGAFNF
jgi:hypothetical protein